MLQISTSIVSVYIRRRKELETRTKKVKHHENNYDEIEANKSTEENASKQKENTSEQKENASKQY